MASKGGREKIKLESTAGTGHFYTTSKNKKTMPEKMSIMKFDPKARKHALGIPARVQSGKGLYLCPGKVAASSCNKNQHVIQLLSAVRQT